ncbi:hypothetical protein Ptr902_04462 [Pyrenophora tritici-repentis]|nr:hypothetical protein Ptr902_04462 [Pyrenophora tritici-repentis]
MEDSSRTPSRIQPISPYRYVSYLVYSGAAVPYHMYTKGGPLLFLILSILWVGYQFVIRRKYNVQVSYALALSLLSILLGSVAHWLPEYLLEHPAEMTELYPLALHFCLIFFVISHLEWIRLRFDIKDPQARYPETWHIIFASHYRARLETMPVQLKANRELSTKAFLRFLRHSWRAILEDVVSGGGSLVTYYSMNMLIHLVAQPKRLRLSWLEALLSIEVLYDLTTVWSVFISWILLRPVRLGNALLWEWILRAYGIETIDEQKSEEKHDYSDYCRVVE